RAAATPPGSSAPPARTARPATAHPPGRPPARATGTRSTLRRHARDERPRALASFDDDRADHPRMKLAQVVVRLACLLERVLEVLADADHHTRPHTLLL